MTAPATEFSACPYLPAPEPGRVLDWRSLNELGRDRGPIFYKRCLAYAQHLWMGGLAARALLAVDRALLAELQGDDPAIVHQPLPYLAAAWLIASTPDGVFIGNPRIHYQHLADRVREPRRAQRGTRAWACWHLARLVRPDLPGDPRHIVTEPTRDETAAALLRHGIAGEHATWLAALEAAAAWPRSGPPRGGRSIVDEGRAERR